MLFIFKIGSCPSKLNSFFPKKGGYCCFPIFCNCRSFGYELVCVIVVVVVGFICMYDCPVLWNTTVVFFRTINPAFFCKFSYFKLELVAG